MAIASERDFDVIVLGAGPIGQNAAERARAAGLRVAIIERELVGGECSYWACVPSKALLRPVIALADARRVDGAREAITGSISADGVFGRRNRYVTDWDDSGQADWVSGIGATLVRGHGRLDGPGESSSPPATSVSGSPRGMRWSCAPEAVPPCPICPEWQRPSRGPTGAPPTAARSRSGWPSWAPAAWVSKWLRPGRDWAPK
ncbi:pyridine nucleotide-disulfide oxidoreductase family protein [Mycobacterium intracellulare]|nr:pyridine nucleotide-disulfide oxidoreductase family protein [Mycobacterium intracellulare]